jgi:hypothetical protein
MGKMSDFFAFSTLELDQIVLGHMIVISSLKMLIIYVYYLIFGKKSRPHNA